MKVFRISAGEVKERGVKFEASSYVAGETIEDCLTLFIMKWGYLIERYNAVDLGEIEIEEGVIYRDHPLYQTVDSLYQEQLHDSPRE